MKKNPLSIPVLPLSPSVHDACSYIQSLVEWIGPGYHPDTDFNDYFQGDHRLFTKKKAAELNREHERACAVLAASQIDPCSIGLKIQRRLIRQLIQQCQTKL